MRSWASEQMKTKSKKTSSAILFKSKMGLIQKTLHILADISQSAFTCSNLTIETLEHILHFVAFLLLTLNM